MRATYRPLTGRSAEFADSESSDLSRRYWVVRAALLDPASVVVYAGADLDITVPQGETWYLLSAWFMRINTVEFCTFHRTPGYHDRPLPLPPGTRLQNVEGGGSGSICVCNPSLVSGNPGYADPMTLYESRMLLLDELPLQHLPFHSTDTSAPNPGSTNVYKFFPEHFERGIVRQVTVQDLAWCALFGPEGSPLGLPISFETSDLHQVRIGEAMYLPFNRSDIPRAGIAIANAPGNGTDPALSSGVFGDVIYQEIPEDF